MIPNLYNATPTAQRCFLGGSLSAGLRARIGIRPGDPFKPYAESLSSQALSTVPPRPVPWVDHSGNCRATHLIKIQ
jgi:hypothetical protein